MSLFSQRMGIQSVEKALQRETMDDELRNRLWSALKLVLWDRWSPTGFYGGQSEDAKQIELLVAKLWLHYFKEPVDTIPEFQPGYSSSAYNVIRTQFFESEWWQAYDLIEFLIKNSPDNWSESLKPFINDLLEQENAAYRVVGEEVAEITSEYESESVETALSDSSPQVATHLSRALELLSDRQQPDYRNSIKESISAVESTCQKISGNSGATLNTALLRIKEVHSFHPAFEQALKKLYGYTSDTGGIRHALTEQNFEPTYSDGKFMLVACSAFINFLWTKASELEA
ncbi:AbiJ-NTD4 domain-containing protein [Salinisphaera orenii]|uniref:AbiJ-NTD4 domain-containing protein n=1 Tax=Salinisphaera orenii TaxID=856731 RepID=UPI000F49E5E9|nr:hypothetical protein [Salinisphaera halophila]